TEAVMTRFWSGFSLAAALVVTPVVAQPPRGTGGPASAPGVKTAPPPRYYAPVIRQASQVEAPAVPNPPAVKAPPQPVPPAAAPASPRLYPPAQPASYPIDLATALRLADADNPTAAVARARVQEAVANYDRARVGWVPNLVFGPTFFYHEGIDQNRRGETFSVARGNFAVLGGPQLRVDLSDALYLPLVARRVVQATESRSRAVTNAVQLEVALTYLDMLELHGLLAVNADTLNKTEQALQAAEAFARAGTGKTAADVNRAATEVELRRQERVVLRGRAAAAAARLAGRLTLDPAIRLVPAETAVVPVVLVPGEYTLDQLVATGLQARPEIAAAGAEVQAAEALVRQAKVAPLLPRVQGEFIGGGFKGGRNDDFGPMRGQYNAGAALVWELDNFGLGNAATTRARQASYAAALQRVREVQARVSTEVGEAAELAAARFETLDAAQGAVRQAQEMYRKFRDVSFGVPGPKGQLQFDALEVLTAVQSLNQARVQYLQQVVEFNRQQFRLYTAIGQPATCGLEAAAPQLLDVPVVPIAPSAAPQPGAGLPIPRPAPGPLVQPDRRP
ncbi:MAG TPA: TolC family protein, partial [Urbifossiella sp.]|nr:TolC family protein [Urbifossiella sp.]